MQMKKTIFVHAVSLFIAGTMITSCQQSGNKVEDARENVVEANQELKQAISDSVQQFKRESEAKISAYDRNIAELKVKIALEKKEDKALYEKNLAELEQRNKEMKRKLAEYKAEGKDDWNSFRYEFKRDMDELGQSLKDFTVKGK